MTGEHSQNAGRDWGGDLGTPVAVLRLEPAELEARGLAFERGFDDLDNIRVTWIHDDMALVRHEGAPNPGTEVVVKGFDPSRASAVSRHLSELLESLGLSTHDLAWTRPDISAELNESSHGAMYWKEITVNWGESDPFGLVYYPRIVAWFNDTEHELFRIIGHPIEQMIKNDRTTFVMGEIHFRFIGPAAYGDRIVTTIALAKVGEHTLHWNCKAKNAVTGAPVSEGRATRVYARINEDGTLKAQPIPIELRHALTELGNLKHIVHRTPASKLVVNR